MRDNDFRLLAMTPNPQARIRLAAAIDDLSDQKVAVLVGAEGPGLSEVAMRACRPRVRIRMSRGTDSLNVATAAALAFYVRAGHRSITLTCMSDTAPTTPRRPGGHRV